MSIYWASFINDTHSWIPKSAKGAWTFSKHRSCLSLLPCRCRWKSHHQKSITTTVCWQVHPHGAVLSLEKEVKVKLSTRKHAGLSVRKRKSKQNKNPTTHSWAERNSSSLLDSKTKSNKLKSESTDTLGLTEGEASFAIPTSYILIKCLQAI